MLELRGVRQRYGGRVVLELDSFIVPSDAQLAIVGHNGSGKSTLLRILALLERPTEGEVLLDGRPVSPGTSAARRRVTLVEQRPVLFRGTVRDNLGYGLRARGIGRKEVDRAIEEVAAALGITPLLGCESHELSEGDVQRVAIARALAVGPDVLLLDEPASSADRAAAQALYRALAAARERRRFAICLASHQLEDAYRWADDIRSLAEGRLAPVTPENLFRVNLPGAASGDLKHVQVGPIAIAVTTDKVGPAILAVPPTDIIVSIASIPSSARNVFRGHVVRLARQRAGTVHVTADVGVELVALVSEEAARDLALAPGASVVFAFKATAVRVF
jgi:tungstate transport system ATP-binding protein